MVPSLTRSSSQSLSRSFFIFSFSSSRRRILLYSAPLVTVGWTSYNYFCIIEFSSVLTYKRILNISRLSYLRVIKLFFKIQDFTVQNMKCSFSRVILRFIHFDDLYAFFFFLPFHWGGVFTLLFTSLNPWVIFHLLNCEPFGWIFYEETLN